MACTVVCEEKRILPAQFEDDVFFKKFYFSSKEIIERGNVYEARNTCLGKTQSFI